LSHPQKTDNRLLPLLQQRQFRLLSLTRFTSRVAQNALNFGLVLLIVDETGKAFASSLLVLALVVPSTVAGIAAGAAADILPKRLLIFLSDVTRLLVCLAFVRGPGNVASYYMVAFAFALAGPFATSAEGAIMPAIVDRADLARANAIGHAVGGVAQLLGLGVVTPVILRLFNSPEILFGLSAALFGVAALQAVAIGRVRRPARLEVGGDRGGRWWLAGWEQMRSDRRVMHAAVELTLMSATLIILGGLVPTYIKDVLGLPVDIGALILTPAAIGVVFGLRVAGFLSHRLPHALLSSAGFTSFVVLLALVTFVNQEASFLGGYGAFAWLNHINIGNFDRGGVLVMALMFPLGFAYATVSVAGQTVLNDLVPLHLQGRVLSTQAAMSAVASSLPVLIAGALTDVFGVTLVMALVCAAISAGAIVNLREPPWLVAEAVSPGR
jgi:MFS family permease